ncbi:PhyH domain-containing protein [Rhizoctonia solani AG-1 IA]|uniref:PhyH domain-containing protein n=1 Tax=Thanatephorus cucumeris (strain AG1-IA) TaxID=983506 RepID=L8WK19_THACA|nr:PhyH domain-containing protein [Rhizoctonia solani AG-1 IA]
MAAYKPLSTLSQDQKDAYARDGYVFISGLIDENELPAFREACDRVVAKTRAGEWPHRRIVGKQFPPFVGDEPDSWGVQHIMHPDLHEPIFVRWYGSEALVGAATSLLGCKEEDVQMGEPSHSMFILGLFVIKIDVVHLICHISSSKNYSIFSLIRIDTHLRCDGIEMMYPKRGTRESGHNAILSEDRVLVGSALYDDACLFVVPGSHREPRTPEQRLLSSTQEAPEDPMDMPGAICVKLKAGDTVFYQNNILHTAAYHPDVKRATLHANMGDIRGGNRRARMILQHQVDWVRGDAFASTLKPEGSPNEDKVATRLKGMRDRLLAMADSVNFQQLGYSQQG